MCDRSPRDVTGSLGFQTLELVNKQSGGELSIRGVGSRVGRDSVLRSWQAVTRNFQVSNNGIWRTITDFNLQDGGLITGTYRHFHSGQW